MDKLGVIGKISDWLISCHVDYSKVKEVFHLELIDIDPLEVETLYHAHKEDTLPEGIFKASFDKDELTKAYHLYLAIKDIIIKYKLVGFTIPCFDLLTSLNTTACLALSLLNSEGYIATCEGDLPAMLTMYSIKKTLHKESFQANPSSMDKENRKIVLAHCTLPLSMCVNYKFDTHFESGIGVAIKGELPYEDLSILRINSDLTKYVVLKGTLIDNLNRPNLCRTQVLLKLAEERSFDYFLNTPLGNHHVIVYSDNLAPLVNYFKSLGLEEVKY